MEHRVEPRFPVSSPIRVIVPGDPARILNCKLIDVSATGIRFISSETVTPDELIAVEVDSRLILGEVRHCQPRGDKFVAGVRRLHEIFKSGELTDSAASANAMFADLRRHLVARHKDTQALAQRALEEIVERGEVGYAPSPQVAAPAVIASAPAVPQARPAAIQMPAAEAVEAPVVAKAPVAEAVEAPVVAEPAIPQATPNARAADVNGAAANHTAVNYDAGHVSTLENHVELNRAATAPEHAEDTQSTIDGPVGYRDHESAPGRPAASAQGETVEAIEEIESPESSEVLEAELVDLTASAPEPVPSDVLEAEFFETEPVDGLATADEPIPVDRLIGDAPVYAAEASEVETDARELSSEPIASTASEHFARELSLAPVEEIPEPERHEDLAATAEYAIPEALAVSEESGHQEEFSQHEKIQEESTGADPASASEHHLMEPEHPRAADTQASPVIEHPAAASVRPIEREQSPAAGADPGPSEHAAFEDSFYEVPLIEETEEADLEGAPVSEDELPDDEGGEDEEIYEDRALRDDPGIEHSIDESETEDVQIVARTGAEAIEEDGPDQRTSYLAEADEPVAEEEAAGEATSEHEGVDEEEAGEDARHATADAVSRIAAIPLKQDEPGKPELELKASAAPKRNGPIPVQRSLDSAADPLDAFREAQSLAYTTASATKSQQRSWRVPLTAAAGLVLATAIAGTMMALRTQAHTRSQGVETHAPMVVSPGAPTPSPSASGAPAAASAPANPNAGAAPGEKPVSATTGVHHVEIKANSATTLRVVADGGDRFQDTLHRGDVHAFDFTKKAMLWLGSAENVEVMLDGVRLPPQKGSARLGLTPTGFAPPKAEE